MRLSRCTSRDSTVPQRSAQFVRTMRRHTRRTRCGGLRCAYAVVVSAVALLLALLPPPVVCANASPGTTAVDPSRVLYLDLDPPPEDGYDDYADDDDALWYDDDEQGDPAVAMGAGVPRPDDSSDVADADDVHAVDNGADGADAGADVYVDDGGDGQTAGEGTGPRRFALGPYSLQCTTGRSNETCVVKNQHIVLDVQLTTVLRVTGPALVFVGTTITSPPCDSTLCLLKVYGSLEIQVGRVMRQGGARTTGTGSSRAAWR